MASESGGAVKRGKDKEALYLGGAVVCDGERPQGKNIIASMIDGV